MGLLALMAFLVRGLIIERARYVLIVPAGVTQVVVGRGRNTRQFTPDATGVFRVGLSGNHYKVVTTTLTAAILIKHALEALNDTLRMNLKPFGIDVIIIEPGGTKTEWNGIATRSMMAQTREDSAYREMVEALAKRPGTYR